MKLVKGSEKSKLSPRMERRLRAIAAEAPIITDDDPESQKQLEELVRSEIRRQNRFSRARKKFRIVNK